MSLIEEKEKEWGFNDYIQYFGIVALLCLLFYIIKMGYKVIKKLSNPKTKYNK